ncbi:hypothetical protein N7522_013429 [Penicillium canescens]|nr:hypothetical protein N7522_013429 [Penicillium canescens]
MDVPPDGGYGWVVVGAIFWNNAHHWGLVSSYGVFLAYFLSNSHFTEGTSLDYAFIGGLSASQALLMAPLASVINRRYGLKVAMSLGVILETAALLGASWSTKVWQLYLSQGVCFGWGLGLQYVSTIPLIPQWFARHRSLAAGLAAAGSGTGGLIYSLGSNAMLERFGYGWTYRILAIVQLVVNCVCLLLIRDRNKMTGTKTSNLKISDILKRYELWLFWGWSFLSIMGFMIIWYSLGDFARSLGLSSHQGSVVTAVMNLGTIIGRSGTGCVSDLLGRMNTASFATFVTGLLCLVLWTLARSYAATLCFAFFGGLVFGTFWMAVAPLAAEVVGLRYLPSCLTLTWVVCVIPATFGEAIGLKLRTSGDREYLHVQLFAGFMYIGASICVFMLRTWKMSTLPESSSEPHISADSKETAIVSVEANDRQSTLNHWLKLNKV